MDRSSPGPDSGRGFLRGEWPELLSKTPQAALRPAYPPMGRYPEHEALGLWLDPDHCPRTMIRLGSLSPLQRSQDP